eukprot:gnl/Chilomastix_cuspidata/786.p2 GENE.gnl/Chilomastix_cuspidata/786~~gnl/Chilomastix_cuspidata/786.p2  ORF type:complete len:455 (-),score=157.38 gnl/Chilomastix_cuspidata/786:1558-2922(-)
MAHTLFLIAALAVALVRCWDTAPALDDTLSLIPDADSSLDICYIQDAETGSANIALIVGYPSFETNGNNELQSAVHGFLFNTSTGEWDLLKNVTAGDSQETIGASVVVAEVSGEFCFCYSSERSVSCGTTDADFDTVTDFMFFEDEAVAHVALAAPYLAVAGSMGSLQLFTFDADAMSFSSSDTWALGDEPTSLCVSGTSGTVFVTSGTQVKYFEPGSAAADFEYDADYPPFVACSGDSFAISEAAGPTSDISLTVRSVGGDVTASGSYRLDGAATLDTSAPTQLRLTADTLLAFVPLFSLGGVSYSQLKMFDITDAALAELDAFDFSGAVAGAALAATDSTFFAALSSPEQLAAQVYQSCTRGQTNYPACDEKQAGFYESTGNCDRAHDGYFCDECSSRYRGDDCGKCRALWFGANCNFSVIGILIIVVLFAAMFAATGYAYTRAQPLSAKRD